MKKELPHLSPRERDVFQNACRGQSNQEIASRLDISVNTVKTHLKSIYKKYDVHTRGELIFRTFSKITRSGDVEEDKN